MPKFYFHVHSNGRWEEDKRGRQYDDHAEACAYAIKSMPQRMAKALESLSQLQTKPLQHGNIYVTVRVVDDKRTACVVKGTVVVTRSNHKAPRQEGLDNA